MSDFTSSLQAFPVKYAANGVAKTPTSARGAAGVNSNAQLTKATALPAEAPATAPAE